MTSKKSDQTRYARVKAILNDAQGDSLPDYQGYRAFWMSIDTFKTAVLYGQRMIAPPLASDANHSANEQDKPSGSGCCGGSTPAIPDTSNTGPAVNAVNTEPTLNNKDPDCWPSGGASGGGLGASGEKRSDRSGIIRGLRGQYPFNGKVFPALLWDAAYAVAADDIAFIADWIDAGCPVEEGAEESKSSHAQVAMNECYALACGDKAHKVSSAPTNADTHGHKGLSVRKEISTLKPDELKRLREAIDCMKQYNEYWLDERSFDYWARIHTNSCQHGWEQFLPWHRLYLYFFEQQLQDYDPLITLPYWAWTDYTDVNRGKYQTEQLDIGVIPEPYRCSLNKAAISNLSNSGVFSDSEIKRMKAQQDQNYNSGRRLLIAIKIPYSVVKNPATNKAEWSEKTRLIYNQLLAVNPLWFPNRWPGSVGRATHYPTKANVEQILAVKDWFGFGGGPEYDHHFGALEELHNGMHNFSGGKNPDYPPPEALGITAPDPQNPENPPYGWMTDNRITAYDMIFWGHHSNVDRMWAKWQTLHANTNPEDLDGALPPWTMTVRDTLSTRKLGYEYMRDSFHYSTESKVAMTLFHSNDCGVCENVLTEHNKAEIRLHQIQRGNLENVQIRIFLNAPDASCETPTEGNDHYVGEVTTFHGSCFGGPGHCDLPLDKQRPFDQRGMHHNTPRNFRIDATATVQRLLGQGAKDLSVHLVMAGEDGKPKDDALFLQGVSLNFLD